MSPEDWLIRNGDGSVLSPLLFTLQAHVILVYHFCCLFVGCPVNIHIFNSIIKIININNRLCVMAKITLIIIYELIQVSSTST